MRPRAQGGGEAGHDSDSDEGAEQAKDEVALDFGGDHVSATLLTRPPSGVGAIRPYL